MQIYCNSITQYKRLVTKEVNVGGLLLGAGHPIRVQTMTTTDTMNTLATVEQTIRCIAAGAELVRITAPSKKEAENLRNIKEELNRRGYHVPLVADIHFTPNAAEVAARLIEKVRINPGNYLDKKKFEFIEYTNDTYRQEVDRIRQRFTPLIQICKQYGTAMRIGTNHGSLSDRIMSRYGDTAMGMVESAMEFLRVARDESYHNIVLSMKSSNPQVMVQAYRMLVQKMEEEFNECYPLHLGVTEAGDGEDGRIKSAAGIGTLLEDGIGDTIRVSLTEDPEFEIPVCKNLVNRYSNGQLKKREAESLFIPTANGHLPYSPFEYRRRNTATIQNIGGKNVPVVVADLSKLSAVTPDSLKAAGYTYHAPTDKWFISDTAADYIFTGAQLPDFSLPGTLKVICYPNAWQNAIDKSKYFPVFEDKGFLTAALKSSELNFVMLNCFNDAMPENDFSFVDDLAADPTVVLCLTTTNAAGMAAMRRMLIEMMNRKIDRPVILAPVGNYETLDDSLLHFAIESGALLLDGLGDGLWLSLSRESYQQVASAVMAGRTYLQSSGTEGFLNNTAFGILQASRTRISKTEYISCPSCGRTLFDLQETTAKIRAVTHHLKGVKIAVMGCIVNGPGEMADADFGYVGSGPGKITLYKGKEVIKRNIDDTVAVDELIKLIKENNAWTEPTQPNLSKDAKSLT